MTWNDVGLERSGLLHFLIGKMHLLRNLIQRRSVRDHWEEDTSRSGCGPLESENGRWRRVSSRADARINKESFLFHLKNLKKKNTLEIDLFEEKSIPRSRTSMGFVTWHPFSFSWFWYPPVTLGNHPFPCLSLMMSMIVLTYPLIPGVRNVVEPGQMEHCFPPALLISSKPMTLWEL